MVAVEPQVQCVDALHTRWPNEARLQVVGKAVGPTDGRATMYVSEADTLTTLSPRWIEATRSSGRFAAVHWERKRQVEVTTLDYLIAEFGRPAFCKIDVEGFEPDVLAGLSHPVAAVSFEFASELLEDTSICVKRLESLGDVRFNYSLAESMQFALPQAIRGERLLEKLADLPDPLGFGDVYAWFPACPRGTEESRSAN